MTKSEDKKPEKCATYVPSPGIALVLKHIENAAPLPRKPTDK